MELSGVLQPLPCPHETKGCTSWQKTSLQKSPGKALKSTFDLDHSLSSNNIYLTFTEIWITMPLCVMLCSKDQEKYQCGKNKIFFRAGLVAYMEKLRSDKLRLACVCIQKTIRCWVARKKYLRMRESAIIIQKYVRGYQARRWVEMINENENQDVLWLQRYWKDNSFFFFSAQLHQVLTSNQSSRCHSA